MRMTHWIAGAAVSMLLAASGAAQADGPYILTSTAGTAGLPTWIGIEKGWFKDAGIDIELKEVTRSSEGLEAMAAGSAHFAEGAFPPLLAAVSGGLPFVIIAENSYGFWGKLIASPENAGLKTLEDFKGKEIGIQVGTGVYTVFMMALEKQGLKESDFVLSNVRVRDMPAARQSGRFDAVMAWEPGAGQIVSNGWGVEAISSGKFEELAEITYPYVTTTTRDMVENHPDAVQKFTDVWVRIQHFMENNKPEVVEMYRKKIGELAKDLSDEELYQQIYHSSKFHRAVLSEADLKDMKATAAFMVKTGQLQSVPDFDTFIDMSFAEKATEAYNKGETQQ